MDLITLAETIAAPDVWTARMAALTALLVVVSQILSALRSNRIEGKTDAIHGLVNGQMGHVLKANAVLAEKVAEVTGNPEDKQIAKEARVVSDDHSMASAVVVAALPDVTRSTVVETLKEGTELVQEKVTKQ